MRQAIVAALFALSFAAPAAAETLLVGNKGEVFVDVKPEGGMAMLDFSAQGDRSGGYVQPNLKPSALSRVVDLGLWAAKSCGVWPGSRLACG